MDKMVNELVQLLPVVLFLCFGAIYCFAGYRFLKFLLAAAGAFLGFAVALLCCNTFAPDQWLLLLFAGLFGALAGGLLFALVYQLAVFSLGFMAGSFVTPMLLAHLPIDPGRHGTAVIVLLAGLCVGLLALQLQRSVLILFTSLVGSCTLAVALELLRRGVRPVTFEDMLDAYQDVAGGYWWLIGVVAAAGMAYQWRARPAAGTN